MPALPSFIIEPIWDQFHSLIPPVVDTHPLGCHRPRVDEHIVFDKLIQVLKWGIPYEGIADETCSATTIRRRRDEWIDAGVGVSGCSRTSDESLMFPRTVGLIHECW